MGNIIHLYWTVVPFTFVVDATVFSDEDVRALGSRADVCTHNAYTRKGSRLVSSAAAAAAAVVVVEDKRHHHRRSKNYTQTRVFIYI